MGNNSTCIPEGMPENDHVGFVGDLGNFLMIFISIFGIIINSFFSFIYIKAIITIKNRNNFGVSAVEKILSVVALVETIISICWLINNIFLSTTEKIINHCGACKFIAYTEIFFYLFDWLILSTSLYQIKILLLNPEQILESGKRVIKFFIVSFIISIFSLIFTFVSDIGGVSPMQTCFIDIDKLNELHEHIFFVLFFFSPMICFGFGVYQIILTIKSPQYKNDKKNKEFLFEYSYFVITYIVVSFFLILSYIINFFASSDSKNNPIYNIFMSFSTFISCSSPLVVGIIRVYRTGLLKRVFSKKKVLLIKEGGEQLVPDDKEHIEEELGRMFDLEKTILEKLIVKYFTAISYALGKSKYVDEENEESKDNKKGIEEETFNPNELVEYIITKDEIIKDLDLSLNEDIKVLQESNIDIEVTEYNSSTFKKLRGLEGFNEDKIISMFQPTKGTNQLISKNNDTLYINSTNKLLMLKQIKKDELLFYQRNVLPGLYNYLVNHPNSIICRVFGLYKIKIDKQKENYMALIYNISESLVSIDNLYLSKRKAREMKISEMELKKNIIIDSNTSNEEYQNFSINIPKSKFSGVINLGGSESDSSSKIFKIYLSEYENEKFNTIIKQDTEFLRGKNVYGFSFLIFERFINKEKSSLFKNDEEAEESKNQINTQPKHKLEIKKYIFNSNRPDIIYNICILDLFRNKV